MKLAAAWRDRRQAMLADPKMLSAIEALDGILSEVDGGRSPLPRPSSSS